MWGEVVSTPWPGERHGSRDGPVLSVTTLSTTDFSAMTRMFRRCYGWTGPGKALGDGLVTLVPWWTARITAPGSSARGSIAGFGIRFVGVLIDWGIASLIARGIFGVPLPFSSPPATGGQNFVVLGVFAVMHLLLVGTVGYTIGHRIMGLQVRSLGGTGRVLPMQALVRTLLL